MAVGTPLTWPAAWGFKEKLAKPSFLKLSERQAPVHLLFFSFRSVLASAWNNVHCCYTKDAKLATQPTNRMECSCRSCERLAADLRRRATSQQSRGLGDGIYTHLSFFCGKNSISLWQHLLCFEKALIKMVIEASFKT